MTGPMTGDADKLRLLADYLDVLDRRNGNDSREVQEDLRRIAGYLSLPSSPASDHREGDG